MQLILLNESDELLRIGRVLGIATVSQPLRPSLIVAHVQVIECTVAFALEKLGMVKKRILGTAIVAIAVVLECVVKFDNRPLPAIALDAKVVVAPSRQIALPGIAL